MDRASNDHQVKPIAWVAAAVILAASIGGAVFVTQWTPMTRTPPPVKPTTSPPPAGRYLLPLDKPAMTLPATLEYGGAIAAYHAGDFAAAARLLDDISRRSPGRAEAEFFLGVSRLLSRDPRGAVEPLNAAIRLSSGEAEQAAQWYLAVALERSGRQTDAATTLEELCREQGPSARSCTILRSFRGP